MCFAPKRRALFRHLNLQKWREHVVFCTFWLQNVLRAKTACTFSTSEPPKVARTCGVLYIFTSKCASRHNGVHFCDIATSKSGPRMVCFVHFDFEMCFAPQRRALFRHLNFQKWSENGVFCAFWLRNVLRATTACNFSTSQLPKVVREWCVLYILTSKCASRHNGVQFFISHLASWLRTRRFSEPTFRPSGATNHWKNTSVSRLSYLFAHLHLLSSDSFSSLIFSLLIFLFSLPLPCSAFHLSILSEVWLLNFLRRLVCKLENHQTQWAMASSSQTGLDWWPKWLCGMTRVISLQKMTWWLFNDSKTQSVILALILVNKGMACHWFWECGKLNDKASPIRKDPKNTRRRGGFPIHHLQKYLTVSLRRLAHLGLRAARQHLKTVLPSAMKGLVLLSISCILLQLGLADEPLPKILHSETTQEWWELRRIGQYKKQGG